jgi:hypothetical protein
MAGQPGKHQRDHGVVPNSFYDLVSFFLFAQRLRMFFRAASVLA